jgi:DNA-binding MarR family transcriptional regulator
MDRPAQKPLTGADTAPRPEGLRERELAVTELLPSLMELKVWLRQVSHEQLSDHAASLAALALVDRCGPARVSDLAEAAHVDSSVVSRQAKALQGAGLVCVDTDPDDRRARRLRLSDDGVRVLAAARRQMALLVQERLDDWSVEDLLAMSTGLRRLVRDLRSTPVSAHPLTDRTFL